MSGRPTTPEPAARVPAPDTDPETTVVLLARAKAGDQAALNHLFERYLVPLKRWAHGRLPGWARDLRDTDDLVQESVMQTLRHVDHFEPQHDGAFLAYLRTALHNKLKDEIKRARRVVREPIATDHPDGAPSVIEEVIGRDTLNRYERSLAQLSAEDRDAIFARVELGKPYAEVAELLGKASADAARMTVTRALLKLARGMGDA
jgi:RNA polymerase sigma-70 factor (ECF subfamily)